MEQDQEDKDPKLEEVWVKVEEGEVKAAARVAGAVLAQAPVVTASARVVERKRHTRWEPPVMSSNVQNAERP